MVIIRCFAIAESFVCSNFLWTLNMTCVRNCLATKLFLSVIIVIGFYAKLGFAVKRYYATESCGHVHGPDHLTVIEFDKDVDYIKNKPSTEQNFLPPLALRDTLWHCVIVIRGMPSAFTKKSIGLEWRSFHIRDHDINTVEQSKESCGKAYVTIYKGSDTSALKHWTFCGKDTTKTFFEWEGDYVTLEFHADFRRDPSYTTPPPPPKTCYTVDEAKAVGGVTDLPLCPKKKGKTPEITDLYPYPEVYFRVDVTSFDYTCNETIQDELLKCNDSQRCLDYSLVCDFYFSQNCKSPGFQQDKSDQSRDAPSYCFRKETTTTLPTTTPAPPPPPFPWEIVAAALGSVFGILTLCWCCWRPGWIPWRISRLRNCPCFRTQHCICFRGPTKCCDCCAAEEEDETNFPPRLGHGGIYSDNFNTGPNVIAGSKLEQMVGRSSMDPRRNSGFNRKPPGNFVNQVSNGNYQPNAGNYQPTTGNYQPSSGNDGNSQNGSIPNGHAPNTQNGSVPYNNGYGQDPNNFATDWLKFISGDGGHLREQR